MTATEPVRAQAGLLRHRDFRLLWAGQSSSDVGTAVSGVVLALTAVVSRLPAVEVPMPHT